LSHRAAQTQLIYLVQIRLIFLHGRRDGTVNQFAEHLPRGVQPIAGVPAGVEGRGHQEVEHNGHRGVAGDLQVQHQHERIAGQVVHDLHATLHSADLTNVVQTIAVLGCGE